jgi:hypothetical protein
MIGYDCHWSLWSLVFGHWSLVIVVIVVIVVIGHCGHIWPTREGLFQIAGWAVKMVFRSLSKLLPWR